MVARSRISLAKDLREAIKTGQNQDSRWVDLISQLTSTQDKEKITRRSNLSTDWRHSGNARQRKTACRAHWRIVIPDVPEIKQQIMREMHEIPYSGHLGYHKTLKKIQQSFYWPEHTLEIRDYVLGCSVCQQEKAVHHVPAGLLQPLKLPEQKWADVSLDYIMGLPKTDAGNDGILTVVDRATKMVHLAPVKQMITAAETARLYWGTIGKLHGIPRSLMSDRDPRFVSKFWRELWNILGSSLRMSSMRTTHRRMGKQKP